MITQETFEQLVSDFEYEVIDSWTQGDDTIVWVPEDETCVQYHKGEFVASGSFESLLEGFLETAE